MAQKTIEGSFFVRIILRFKRRQKLDAATIVWYTYSCAKMDCFSGG